MSSCKLPQKLSYDVKQCSLGDTYPENDGFQKKSYIEDIIAAISYLSPHHHHDGRGITYFVQLQQGESQVIKEIFFSPTRNSALGEPAPQEGIGLNCSTNPEATQQNVTQRKNGQMVFKPFYRILGICSTSLKAAKASRLKTPTLHFHFCMLFNWSSIAICFRSILNFISKQKRHV